jgi:hypothetical protein
MTLEFVLVTAIGTLAYLALTLLAGPLIVSIESRAVHGHDSWRPALPIVAGMCALTVAAATAAVILAAIGAPAVVEHASNGPALPAGAAIGIVLWGIRATTLGVPRCSERLEVAMALAVLDFTHADAAAREEAARAYRVHVIDGQVPSSRPSHVPNQLHPA